MTVTREDVLSILGRMDDVRLAEIIATQPTAAELTEAKLLAAGLETPSQILGRPLSAKVVRIADLIRQEDADWEDR